LFREQLRQAGRIEKLFKQCIFRGALMYTERAFIRLIVFQKAKKLAADI